jgi:CTP:molybdopterin cytidylyltransferase MocA
MTTPAAVVLAAGEGRRMGGPKALLVVDGKPLVRSHVERLREVGCLPVIVVVRAAILEQVREILVDAPGVRVIGGETSAMADSLRLGLEHVTPTANQVIVISTVDSLPARCSTLHALIAAAMAEGVQVATPCHAGRSGHPVVARERLLRAFRRGYAGTLRDLIRSAGSERRRVDVEDAAVVHDFDTPDDLTAARPGLLPDFRVGE